MSEACLRSVSLPEPLLLHGSGRENSGAGSSPSAERPQTSPMLVLKLHGSVNWRIALGHRKPYSIDALRHHEVWFQYYEGTKLALKVIEPVLESEPFFVPPILTKSDLVKQPILRLIWTLALKKLRKGKRVVFIGYSLPITDIAAGFLFREGLRRRDHEPSITVVDWAETDETAAKKLDTLRKAYQNVFPSLAESQIQFCGAAKWIRDNLTDWVYDSKGKPIAYRALHYLISADGDLIGRVTKYPYPEREEVWWESYKGEIVRRNRFLYKRGTYDNSVEWAAPGVIPAVPQLPDDIDAISLPDGYIDVVING
jgi:hypothetical protein